MQSVTCDAKRSAARKRGTLSAFFLSRLGVLLVHAASRCRFCAYSRLTSSLCLGPAVPAVFLQLAFVVAFLHGFRAFLRAVRLAALARSRAFLGFRGQQAHDFLDGEAQPNAFGVGVVLEPVGDDVADGARPRPLPARGAFVTAMGVVVGYLRVIHKGRVHHLCQYSA